MKRRDFVFLLIGLGLGLSVGVGMIAQMIWMTHAFIFGVSNWFALCAVVSIPIILIFSGVTLILVDRRTTHSVIRLPEQRQTTTADADSLRE
jgi:hypothetical protein